jgi:hypothetical protein
MIEERGKTFNEGMLEHKIEATIKEPSGTLLKILLSNFYSLFTSPN